MNSLQAIIFALCIATAFAVQPASLPAAYRASMTFEVGSTNLRYNATVDAVHGHVLLDVETEVHAGVYAPSTLLFRYDLSTVYATSQFSCAHDSLNTTTERLGASIFYPMDAIRETSWIANRSIGGESVEVWSSGEERVCLEVAHREPLLCAPVTLLVASSTGFPISLSLDFNATFAAHVSYTSIASRSFSANDSRFDTPTGQCWAWPSCYCTAVPEVWTFGPIRLCQAPLTLSWIIAVVLGVLGAKRLLRNGLPTYAVTFGMYAVMISSGFIVHCVYLVECYAEVPDTVYKYVALFDGAMSSTIAVTFFINGLVDIGLLSGTRWTTFALEAAAALGMLIAYRSGNFFALYFIGIQVMCGLYVLIQIFVIVFAKNRPHRLAAVFWLLLGGAAGLIGLRSFMTTWACKLCLRYGGWVREGIWYYLSDFSMYCMLQYVVLIHEKKDDGEREREGERKYSKLDAEARVPLLANAKLYSV